ncbi:MAG: STAS/SEC14 domain-containing protein [Bacteroidetes bacterium]|nr:STAS/SEC14 domain-containing protein [Bacteroidota bacterium]
MQIQIPTDRPVYDGEIATYWLDDGILVSLSKPTPRTVEVIARNVEFVKGITGGTPVPMLIYLAKSPVPDKATRAFSAQMVPVIYKAMAMVAKPGLSQIVMKMVFALKPPPIPTKSFSNDTDAKAWLKQFK